MEIKVSIIIPIYNVKLYLDKCIQSALNQTFHEYEIILINDGSTDSSGEIARKYWEIHKEIIILINQENKGLGGARNTGIIHARGEYLFFMDSDDFIESNAVELVYQKAKKEKADLVIFDGWFLEENGEKSYLHGCLEKREEWHYEQNKELLFENPSTWNKLYHRNLFLNHNIFFPEKVWFEDLRTTPKIYTVAKKIVYLQSPLYYYLQRNTSIMHSKECEKYLQILDAVDDVVAYYKEKDLYQAFEKHLEYLAVYNSFFFAGIKVNKINYKSPVQTKLVCYMKEKFPYYKRNPYRNKFSMKAFLIQYFLEQGHYKILRICFSVSAFLKRFKIKKKQPFLVI